MLFLEVFFVVHVHQDICDSSEMEAALSSINDAAVAGLHIVDEVLDWRYFFLFISCCCLSQEKTSSLRRKAPTRDLFSLSEVRDRSQNIVKALLEPKCLKLTWKLSDERVKIATDFNRVRQVIIGFITNAIKVSFRSSFLFFFF